MPLVRADASALERTISDTGCALDVKVSFFYIMIKYVIKNSTQQLSLEVMNMCI